MGVPDVLLTHRARPGRLLLGLACALLSGCREPVSIERGPGDWDVLARVRERDSYALTASADGALFVTTFSGAVHRSRPGVDAEWSQIVEPSEGQPRVARLYAPSARTFIGFGSGLVRWDEGVGLRQMPTAEADSVADCGDFITGVGFNDIWGRSDRDVYVVGDHGIIMHYDGSGWTRVPNALEREAPSRCVESFETDLLAVGGNDRTAYAAGVSVIRTNDAGEWERVPRPTGPETGGMIWGVAGQPDGALFGGGEFQRFGDAPPYRFAEPPRLFRLGPGGWELVHRGLADDVLGMSGGSAVPGGLAVFWNFDGHLLIVDGRAVRPLRLTGLLQLRGAVALGRTVYALGSMHDEDVVIRLRSWR